MVNLKKRIEEEPTQNYCIVGEKDCKVRFICSAYKNRLLQTVETWIDSSESLNSLVSDIMKIGEWAEIVSKKYGRRFSFFLRELSNWVAMNIVCRRTNLTIAEEISNLEQKEYLLICLSEVILLLSMINNIWENLPFERFEEFIIDILEIVDIQEHITLTKEVKEQLETFLSEEIRFLNEQKQI